MARLRTTITTNLTTSVGADVAPVSKEDTGRPRRSKERENSEVGEDLSRPLFQQP